MKTLKGKIAVITGAASGIGLATARALANEGAKVAICDINPSRLNCLKEELLEANVEVFASLVDVSKKDQMADFSEEVCKALGTPHILVNNAGVAVASKTQHMSLEDWDWILGINIQGIVHGLHAFLPRMVDQNEGGHIINIASAFAFTSGAMTSAYAASKHFVLGLSRGLRLELEEANIGVTAICPGIINTNIAQDTRTRGVDKPKEMRQLVVDFFSKTGAQPDKVAQAIVRAIQKNRPMVLVGKEAYMVYFLSRFFPWLLPILNRKMEHMFFKRL